MAGGAALSVGSITFAVSSNKILELIGARVSPKIGTSCGRFLVVRNRARMNDESRIESWGAVIRRNPERSWRLRYRTYFSTANLKKIGLGVNSTVLQTTILSENYLALNSGQVCYDIISKFDG